MIKIFNFSNVNSATSSKVNAKNALSIPHFSNVKLRPLLFDTISFTSKSGKGVSLDDTENTFRESSQDSKEMQSKARSITSRLAHIIFKEADYNRSQMKRVLLQSLAPLIQLEGLMCDYEHPIYRPEFRTKSPNSIREKASQKHLQTKEGVIDNIHDLVGARIILGSNQKGCAERVIDKLIECVNSGKFKVVEIENHVSSDRKGAYISQTKLHKLAQASSDRYGIIVREGISRRETGYMGIHLLVEFPDGITGEIQILGHDVAVFKELEDVPYKILLGKSVDKEYGEIKRIISSLLPVNDDPLDPENIERLKKKKEFIAYTAAAYRHEREKEFSSTNKGIIPVFLTLEEFSAAYKRKTHLGSELDFNNLYKLKMIADIKKRNSLK